MLEFAILVPALIAFGEVLKRIFGVDSKWIPTLLLFTGIVVSLSVEGLTPFALLNGFVAVATALGLYSGVKATPLPLGARNLVSRKKK